MTRGEAILLKELDDNGIFIFSEGSLLRDHGIKLARHANGLRGLKRHDLLVALEKGKYMRHFHRPFKHCVTTSL